jgi:[protein-PII] uridylyltransferase
VVLDVFDVCDRDLKAVTDERAIKTAEEALQRMLRQEQEIDFQELLKRMRAGRAPLPRIREVNIPTVIGFDNETTKARTIIEVQTEDQLGLLYTLTRTITDLGLDISFAKIATEKGAAIDSFYVQDVQGGQVTEEDRLQTIRQRLEEAIHLLTD